MFHAIQIKQSLQRFNQNVSTQRVRWPSNEDGTRVFLLCLRKKKKKKDYPLVKKHGWKTKTACDFPDSDSQYITSIIPQTSYHQPPGVLTLMLTGWLVSGIPTPLKNDGVSNSWDDDSIPTISWESQSKFHASKPPTRYMAVKSIIYNPIIIPLYLMVLVNPIRSRGYTPLDPIKPP